MKWKVKGKQPPCLFQSAFFIPLQVSLILSFCSYKNMGDLQILLGVDFVRILLLSGISVYDNFILFSGFPAELEEAAVN